MTASGYSSFISVNLESETEAKITANIFLKTGMLIMNDDTSTEEDMEVAYQLISAWHYIKEANTFKEKGNEK